MIRLKVNVVSPARGVCDCYLDMPKEIVKQTGLPEIRATVESIYESLGVVVLSVCRVEEVMNEL